MIRTRRQRTPQVGAALIAAATLHCRPSHIAIEMDDALFLVPICGWLDWLMPLLVVSSVVAPLCAVAMLLFFRRDLTPEATG